MQNRLRIIRRIVQFLTILYCLLVNQSALYSNNTHPVLDSIITEILVMNTQEAELEGSLVYLETDHRVPLVIFISGSGPTDRDGNQTGLQNDCFKMLAEELAKNEIASFRFDKRGIGASTNSMDVEDLRFHHFVDDIEAWADQLIEDGRFSSITIMGHSLGSLMGMVASQSINANAFISLAGPGRPLDSLMYDQFYQQSPFLAKGAKPIIDSLKNGFPVKEVHPFLATVFPKALHNYLISVFKYDPSIEISKLNIPTLIIQGSHDIQVAVKDAHILDNAAKDSKMIIIDGMNHVLKNAPKDRNENILSYTKPDLPLNTQLVDRIVEFIIELK